MGSLLSRLVGSRVPSAHSSLLAWHRGNAVPPRARRSPWPLRSVPAPAPSAGDAAPEQMAPTARQAWPPRRSAVRPHGARMLRCCSTWALRSASAPSRESSFAQPTSVRRLRLKCPSPAARNSRLTALISAVCTRTKCRRRDRVSRKRATAGGATCTITR